MENNTLPTLRSLCTGPLHTSNHIAKTKAKFKSRNSTLKKLANTKWGIYASTICTIAFTICYSTAEYASPLWSRWSCTKKIKPASNSSYRSSTGCLKPTKVDDHHLLSSIAPAYVRRTVHFQLEKLRQEIDFCYPLYCCEPMTKRLNSSHSVLYSVEPLNDIAPNQCLSLRCNNPNNVEHRFSLSAIQNILPGFSDTWPFWFCLNRLQIAVGCCRANQWK